MEIDSMCDRFGDIGRGITTHGVVCTVVDPFDTDITESEPEDSMGRGKEDTTGFGHVPKGKE